MNLRRTAVLTAFLLLLGVHAQAAPAHPSLLFKKEDVAGIKERIAKYEWAKNAWDRIKKNTDTFLDETVELPPRGETWRMYFICNSHSSPITPLEKTGKWEWKYKCNIGGEILTGSTVRPELDYDGVMIGRTHGKYANMMMNLGFVYQLTGEKKYFDKSRELLIAYADAYRSYKLHDNGGKEAVGGGRVTSNTLNESIWLIDAAEGADMIWEGLSEADRKKISEGLFLPAARDVILPSKYGVHNIQCWKNAAVGLAGFLTDDRELTEYSINDPKEGYREQLKSGVLPDGMWYESTWNYHFFALNPIVTLAEAARNNGTDLYTPELKKMFDVAIDSAMPNSMLPNFNDSGYLDLKRTSAIYELAYARFGNERYRNIILKNNRENYTALFCGNEINPEGSKEHFSGRNTVSSGFAALASGEGEDATWVCVKHGAKGNGHSHSDKLGFILYSKGSVIGPDPGTCNYTSMLYGQWYRTTVAHNTLVVGQRDQNMAEGRCIKDGNIGPVSYAILDAGKIYDWAAFTRTVILTDKDTVLFVDRVNCDKPRVLDIAYHNNGKFTAIPPGEKWEVPGNPGYTLLKNTEIRELKADDQIKITFGATVSAVSVMLNEPTSLITGDGIGKDINDLVPVILLRRKAKNTVFVWGVSLKGEKLALKLLAGNDDSVSFSLSDRSVFTVTKDEVTVK